MWGTVWCLCEDQKTACVGCWFFPICKSLGQARCCGPSLPEFRRQRQVGICELEASVVSVASSRPTSETYSETLSSKINKQTKGAIPHFGMYSRKVKTLYISCYGGAAGVGGSGSQSGRAAWATKRGLDHPRLQQDPSLKQQNEIKTTAPCIWMSIAIFIVGHTINNMGVCQLDWWITSVNIFIQWSIQQSKALRNALINLESFM